MTYLVGITGGIGAGKTTAAGFLSELGVDVIDTDHISRELTRSDTEVLREIRVAFGEHVFDQNEQLHRKRLAAIVFSDRKKLELLNSILHPRIRECWEERITECESPVVFVAIPLLFEKNLEDRFDEIWVVIASEDERIRRVIERDGITRQEVLDRMKNQVPVKDKLARADVVIDSSEGFEVLRDAVAKSLLDLKGRLGLEAQS